MSASVNSTIASHIDYIMNFSRNDREKGDLFENLVAEALRQLAEYEIKTVYKWADWPQREQLTGLSATDIGIDLVAVHNDDKFIAIQCKCYAKDNTVSKKDIDSFLAASQQKTFTQRWIVTTSDWTKNADDEVKALSTPVKRIDFLLKHGEEILHETSADKEPRELRPKQLRAVQRVVKGFKYHDRGKLVMACGTGKTFTSLRIAEEVVRDGGGGILFVCPSISLVSQSRKEWLTHTQRPLKPLVICSDSDAGGRNISYKVSDLVCDVTTDSQEIAAFLKQESGSTKVLFCTYQSLKQVIKAQKDYDAPDFDLTICDEAHRTTGVMDTEKENKSFQAVHFEIESEKRLYMTATERIYTTSSKKSLKSKGYEVIDMGDPDIYGIEFDRLKFKDAVNEDMLSDFRLIVMGSSQDSIPTDLQYQLMKIIEKSESYSSKTSPLIITSEDIAKIVASALAINGVIEGRKTFETPKQLYRSIAFANSIKNSKYYSDALSHHYLEEYIAKRSGKALPLEAKHLDASHNAYQREQELNNLRKAETDNTARVLCNVGLFGEGVDVPTLDAIIFLEPRKSQIDIVQAVGRVMRRAKGKKLGYIILPIPVAEGQTMEEALAEGTSNYEVIGQVIKALQSHDERLAENQAQFITVVKPETNLKSEDDETQTDDEAIQWNFNFKIADFGDSVYAQILSASGLGKAGQLVTEQISYEIDKVTRFLVEGRSEAIEDADFIDKLARALGEQVDGNEKNICKIGALLIANACILQKRLQSLDIWKEQLMDMADINLHGLDAIALLRQSWQTILQRDYKPVFEPALAVLEALPNRPFVAKCLHILIECAVNLADELTDLGYDHAGSLYHKIMPNAKEMGAFYTNNLSALLLAKLSIRSDFVDWHDQKAIANLKIMDPACGTGTLLMASVKVMKEHFAKAHDIDLENLKDLGKDKLADFHKTLVENVVYGLDINQGGVQLAAANLTLGNPNVDYRRMNLHTLKHGIDSYGTARGGSLDILNSQLSLTETLQSNTQVNNEDALYPVEDIDLVIMNPPFKNNIDRNSQYSAEAKTAMQEHEGEIKKMIIARDESLEGVISNSISTFFTPIADKILNSQKGVLAKIMPVTACTSASGVKERQFLAKKFHIERIIASHDPKRPNFSENTGINECLLVGRRYSDTSIDTPTEFISLKRMPQTLHEVEELYAAIVENNDLDSRWLTRTYWSAGLMKNGDWSPVQWLNNKLAEIAIKIKGSPNLEPLGNKYKISPVGRSVRDIYRECSPNEAGAKLLFWSISSKIRTKLVSKPESWRSPKPDKYNLAKECWRSRNNVLIAQKMNTVINSLSAVWSETASIGSLLMPVNIDKELGKGLVAWWNSTPAMIMLLSMRSGMLTYVNWSQQQLHSMRIPKPDNPGWIDLIKAFEATKDKEILTLKDGEKCEVRKIIDKAAAKALGISEDEVAKWRSMLAKEPTITGRYTGDTI